LYFSKKQLNTTSIKAGSHSAREPIVSDKRGNLKQITAKQQLDLFLKECRGHEISTGNKLSQEGCVAAKIQPPCVSAKSCSSAYPSRRRVA
jgi:hypothetical protein